MPFCRGPAVKLANPLCVLMSVTVIKTASVLTWSSDGILLNIHETASASRSDLLLKRIATQTRRVRDALEHISCCRAESSE